MYRFDKMYYVNTADEYANFFIFFDSSLESKREMIKSWFVKPQYVVKRKMKVA